MTDIQEVILEELRYIRGKVDKLSTSVAKLKVKSGLWGTIGGALILLLWIFI